MSAHPCRPLLKTFAGIAVALAAILAHTSTASATPPAQDRPLFGLPEITTALDRDRQLTVRLALRLSGPQGERLVRDNAARLRHTLVLQLADRDPEQLDAAAIEALAEDFRTEANALLGAHRAIRTVLVQKFVVQGK